MSQLSLFGEAPKIHVVNVASVPHRSPFRYPGGKTWLVPTVRCWINAQDTRPKQFIEPFAGGGIIGLTVAFEKLADHVTLVELDSEVAAVWQTILSEDGAWLADRIIAFQLTPETVQAALSGPVPSIREQAFQTILRNRVNRGGILAPGAGRAKHGENGKGLRSRWYPATLRKRILDIMAIGDRLTFIHGDGLEILRRNAHQPDILFFIDPPYTADGKKAGNRLYTHHELDHAELFRIASALSGDFLMTYDEAEGVRKLARRHCFDLHATAMKNTHHTRMNELLIGRNLNWARKMQ